METVTDVAAVFPLGLAVLLIMVGLIKTRTPEDATIALQAATGLAVIGATLALWFPS